MAAVVIYEVTKKKREREIVRLKKLRRVKMACSLQQNAFIFQY